MNGISGYEILAPVGGSEQLLAAVRCGADAVYLGTGGFNARRNAENFSGGALSEAVSFCHIRGVRVYVTLNTLVFDEEIDALDEEIRNIALSGADAVIVQDLAVVSRVKAACPEIPLHASTQMAVHNAAGVRELEKMGFSRVVLARELSLAEIKSIRTQTSAELEAFVHGAHCMSVSGMCYLSSMLGGRSGNRGLCAQPCRLDFTSGGREYALSLKDMSVISQVSELHGAGICSFKIEGRMKRPEYVAAAVTALKNAVNGKAYDEESLRAVFSRSGFTDGYLNAKRDSSMFGVRSKEDVTAAAEVLKKLRGLYAKEYGTVPLYAGLSLHKGSPASLTVGTDEKYVTVTGDIPESGDRQLRAEDAQRFLSKTGGTPFCLEKTDIDIESGITMSCAQINSLRREALSQLEKKLSEVTVSVRCAPKPGLPEHTAERDPSVRIRAEKLSQLPDGINAEYIYVPVSELIKNTGAVGKLSSVLIAELPAIIYPGTEKRLMDELSELKELGVSRAATGNIGGIELIKRAGLIAHGQSGLNIVNSISLSEYGMLGLCDTEVSFETTFGRLKRQKGEMKRGIIGYGYLPLMRLRACPVMPRVRCRECSGLSVLKDARNTEFTVMCHNREYMTVLNSVPLYIGDKKNAPVDFYTLYFTIEDNDTAKSVCNKFVHGEELKAERTNGLYFREIL